MNSEKTVNMAVKNWYHCNVNISDLMMQVSQFSQKKFMKIRQVWWFDSFFKEARKSFSLL